jgi:hypothetical protein
MGRCRSLARRGQESIAQGLPWVLDLSPEALKGRPLTRHLKEPRPRMPGPFRASR